MAVCVAVIGKDNGPLYMRVVGRRVGNLSTVGGPAAGLVQGPDSIISSSSSSIPGEELEYHYIVSSALDIIEERVQNSYSNSLKSILNSNTPTNQQQYYSTDQSSGASNSPSSANTTRELYLGSLTAQEDHKVYGYMTNTRIKLILVIEEQSHSSPLPIRENDIRMMFRKLHGAFCDLMSNPFYSPGSLIQSRRFSSVVDSILLKT